MPTGSCHGHKSQLVEVAMPAFMKDWIHMVRVTNTPDVADCRESGICGFSWDSVRYVDWDGDGDLDVVTAYPKRPWPVGMPDSIPVGPLMLIEQLSNGSARPHILLEFLGSC